MATQLAPDPDVAVLQMLPRKLLRHGYVDAYLVHGPIHAQAGPLRDALPALPPALRALVSLFALGKHVPIDALSACLSDAEIGALVRLGVLVCDADAVWASGLRLAPILEHLVFMPASGADAPRYLGDDTAALAVRLRPPRGGSCLNLCAGVGIQALRCATVGESVVASIPRMSSAAVVAV